MIAGTMRSRVTSAFVVALLGLAFGASGAGGAQEPHIVSGPAATFYGYLTPVMVVEKGGALVYTNADIVQHDVVQDVGSDGMANKKKRPWCKNFPKRKCPIFWSKRAGLSRTVPVKGLGDVKPGTTYTFYCTLHPGMKGSLIVAP